jgi:hypothetical protein
MGSNRESFGSGEKKRIEKGKNQNPKKEKIKTSCTQAVLRSGQYYRSMPSRIFDYTKKG